MSLLLRSRSTVLVACQESGWSDAQLALFRRMFFTFGPRCALPLLLAFSFEVIFTFTTLVAFLRHHHNYQQHHCSAITTTTTLSLLCAPTFTTLRSSTRIRSMFRRFCVIASALGRGRGRSCVDVRAQPLLTIIIY